MNRTLTRRLVSDTTNGIRASLEGVRSSCSTSLLNSCLNGDADAWDAFFRQNEPAVYRLAYGMCKNTDDASDIVSQVLLKIYCSLHTYCPSSNFNVWVHAIIRNTFLDTCIRSRWRNRVSLETPAGWESDEPWLNEFVDPAPTPETVCMQHETAKLVSREMWHLTMNHRQVLTMFVEEGKTYRQISAEMGLPVGTVRSRINRARRELRNNLMPYQDVLLPA